MADVGKVLDCGVGVAVALEHQRLGLILVEEDFVLERAAVPGPHDLHGLFRQALPFLDLAGMKFDPCDSFDLVHCRSLSKFPAQRFWSRLVSALIRQGSNLGAHRCKRRRFNEVDSRARIAGCAATCVAADKAGIEARAARAHSICKQATPTSSALEAAAFQRLVM